MESSPGLENRKQYNKLKEIGMDKLASMQAVRKRRRDLDSVRKTIERTVKWKNK